MNEAAPAHTPALRDSLERKLISALCVTALIFSAVAGAVQFTYSYHQEIEHNRGALDNLAATVHSSASIAAFVGNDDIANDVVEGLLRNADILAVTLEGNSGYQVRRWKNPSAPIWVQDNAVSYPLLSPTGDSKQIGTLSMLTDAQQISSRARHAALLQLLTLVAQTVVLALIMLLAFRRLIGRPLSGLTRQLHTVTPGRSQRIETDASQAGNEIGLLASSLNRYLAASEDAINAERELRLRVESMENHYRRIFESTHVGVMLLEEDGMLVNCNSVLRNHILRAAFEQEASDEDFLAVAFKHADKAWALVEQARTKGGIAQADLELRHGNGRSHWAQCLFSLHTPGDGSKSLIECVLVDVTSRREREQTALRTAERDALTDLINRRGADSYLERSIRDARLSDLALTVFYIDLDGFKQANDTYGHEAGDQVLIEVAARFGRILRRSSDLLARFGGDEFMIAIYGCGKHSHVVKEMADRLLASLATPIQLADGSHVNIGASIGIAAFPEDGDEPEVVLRAADQAMYNAKRSGKNRYAYAVPASSAGN